MGLEGASNEIVGHLGGGEALILELVFVAYEILVLLKLVLLSS